LSLPPSTPSLSALCVCVCVCVYVCISCGSYLQRHEWMVVVRLPDFSVILSRLVGNLITEAYFSFTHFLPPMKILVIL
jgi:hypothetical protein